MYSAIPSTFQTRSIPGVGLILLVIGVVFIAVLLGVGVVIYLTLQSMHIWTATIFTVAALLLFYIATNAKIINEQTLKKFPWLPLLIPGAFLFGYVADIGKLTTYTVAPMAVATPQQAGANALVLFLAVSNRLHIRLLCKGLRRPAERTRRRRHQ